MPLPENITQQDALDYLHNLSNDTLAEAYKEHKLLQQAKITLTDDTLILTKLRNIFDKVPELTGNGLYYAEKYLLHEIADRYTADIERRGYL